MDAAHKSEIILIAIAVTDMIVWQSALQIMVRSMKKLRIANTLMSIGMRVSEIETDLE
jgi:hypothetical protein